MAVTHRWPLPCDHRAAGEARRLVRSVLADWPFVDDAILVASELAANAIEHGEQPVELRLDVFADRVRVCVVNAAGDRIPEVRTVGDDAARGRGLALVHALAADWGWEHDGDRLSVWADLVRP